jgi:integrase
MKATTTPKAGILAVIISGPDDRPNSCPSLKLEAIHEAVRFERLAKGKIRLEVLKDLLPGLMAELEQHLETIDAAPETLLFTGEKGGPLRYRFAYMDIWRPMLKELGMPTVGMHALRHSAAARMLSAGTSPKAVQ